MATPYNHKAIEQKWRKHWQEHPVNVNDGKKPKYYCLDMFPYPSGSGLHVGHWRGYVISDVWSRYKLLNGYYVIHPMGWDAFGLPAENYAIKMGTHPRISTEANIKNIKRQINEISAIYDWDMEVNTTDPEFYKWTQWIFVKMFKKGLAYEKQMPINWCPSCKTGLANEEVVNGKCERCGADVTKKNLRQLNNAPGRISFVLKFSLGRKRYIMMKTIINVKNASKNRIAAKKTCLFSSTGSNRYN